MVRSPQWGVHNWNGMWTNVDRSEGKTEWDPKHSQAEAIIANFSHMLRLLNFFFLHNNWDVVNSHKLHTRGQRCSAMKQTLSKHIHWLLLCIFWMDGSLKAAPLPVGKWKRGICPAVLPLCLFLFVSTMFIHPSFSFFFYRKHNHSQLAWSQGEHDHGNHTGDQSRRRISGEEEALYVFYIKRKRRSDLCIFPTRN